MPRYLVERHFPAGVDAGLGDDGLARIADASRSAEVAWLYSYVTDDATTMFCLYQADSPEAVRKASRRAGLPVDVIRRVSVLDPYGWFATPRATSAEAGDSDVPQEPARPFA
jgi:hypothetical protein